ncbi:MAG: hypothetical protein KIS92_10515 [Planctomycetota bacterium]|nr:hypothetical protein [Planctomycetota bacterium]
MLCILGFVAVAGLGVLGAAKTARLFLAGEHGQFIFRPLGALLYLSACAFAFFFYLLAERAATAGSGTAGALPLVVVVPVLLMPYGLYLAGLIVEICSGFFNASASQGELRTYDKGDAALARGEFERAAVCFREDIKRWPGDTDAILRLARALEAAGRTELAASELNAARLDLLNETGDAEAVARPSLSGGGLKRDRNERVLLLTFALGDLYEGPLANPARAKALYEETLELKYGEPRSEPLRDRLRKLETRLREAEAGAPDAAEAATGRLSLD